MLWVLLPHGTSLPQWLHVKWHQHSQRDTQFGLAAYYFTNDYRTGIYLNDELNYGVVGWNDGAPSAPHAPFGGVKESGYGREGGIEGIEPYLEKRYLSIGNLNTPE